MGRIQEANWGLRPEDGGAVAGSVHMRAEGGDNPSFCLWEPEERWELSSNVDHTGHAGTTYTNQAPPTAADFFPLLRWQSSERGLELPDLES